MRNPLIPAILTLLKDNLNGISEFDILNTLKKQFPEFNQLAQDANLQLFRQHFVIMNALYQLQQSLWQEEKLTLSISALQIKLLASTDLQSDTNGDNTSGDISHHLNPNLAAYYLDWDEYEKTDENEVSRLIGSFYQRMNSADNKQSALDILNISSASPSKTEIKQQYRKLVRKHHPDSGGNPEMFIEIRQAYEQLLE
ncbi:DNA-J related domain-containing protein [Gammaproteobacteria bacterium AS21]